MIETVLRNACTISMEEEGTVMMTGGFGNERTVSIYSTQGWVEDYAQLLTGRYNHGCGHYINSDNEKVLFCIA